MVNALKADSHSKRGKGVSRKVVPLTAVPEKWHKFLHYIHGEVIVVENTSQIEGKSQ